MVLAYPPSHSWRYQVGGSLAWHKSMPIYTLNPFDISRYCMAASKSRAPGKLFLLIFKLPEIPTQLPWRTTAFLTAVSPHLNHLNHLWPSLSEDPWSFLPAHVGTNVNIFSLASSSSLRFRDKRTRTRRGTLRTPLLQRNLFNFVSMRTSFVNMTLEANCLNHSHSSRCSLLEGDLLHVLVKMNGAISGHRLLARTGSLLLFLHHDHTSQSKHDEVWAKMASRKVACFFSLRIWKEIIRRYHRSGKLCEVYLDLFLYMFEGGAVLDQSSCKKCVVQITHHDTNSIQKKCPTHPCHISSSQGLVDWLQVYIATHGWIILPPLNSLVENPVRGSKRLLPSGLSIAWMAFQSYNHRLPKHSHPLCGQHVNQTKKGKKIWSCNESLEQKLDEKQISATWKYQHPCVNSEPLSWQMAGLKIVGPPLKYWRPIPVS